MSRLHWSHLPVLACLMTLSVHAEANRPFYSLENKLPRWEQLEVGVEFRGTEVEDLSIQDDTLSTSIYARYGLLDDFAVQVEVPFLEVDPAMSESESGIGDVELEFQLRAYEDIFGYPYFLPYLNIALPTGDDDKGLGKGDVTLRGGLSYGSKINDWIAWVLDVSYRVNQDEDNQVVVGHSYVWEVSEEFALLTELFYEQALQDGEDATVLISGGFSYHWTPALEMSVGIAGGITGATDIETNAQLSYSF